MKYKDNCGVDSSTLEKGYSDTGGIPEDGESVFTDEKTGEGNERSMLRMMGFPDEVDAGGFLERNNYRDRY